MSAQLKNGVIVNCQWEDDDLEYIRNKFPKKDQNWDKIARGYITYTSEV